MGWEGLTRSDDDRHTLAVLDTVVGGGMSSRLFQEIREKRGLAYSVYSYRAMFADSGSFAVYAGTTPQNAATVMDIVREEMASIVSDGITEAELERAKGHLRGSLVLAAEDPGSRMNRLGKQQLTTGEIISVDELIAKFNAIGMDDVRRVIDTVLGSDSYQTTVIGPFEEDAFDRYAGLMIRVGVIGAAGRMGSEVCRMVEGDAELELAARVGRDHPLESLLDNRVEVSVEFSTPASVKDNVAWCLAHGIHAVVGATGLKEADLSELDELCRERGSTSSSPPTSPLARCS